MTWKEKQITNAKREFKDFIVEFKDYKDLQTIDWRNKNGSNNYHIHYILDIKQQYMHISGDLGSACFCLTWQPCFENVHSLLRDPGYILGKMECATDKYVYPEEYVRAEIEEYYAESRPQRENFDDEEEFWEETEKFENTVNDFINAHDYKNGFMPFASDCFEDIEELDPEWYEHNFGCCVAPRVYLWLVGLEMAYEQYTEKSVVK